MATLRYNLNICREIWEQQDDRRMKYYQTPWIRRKRAAQMAVPGVETGYSMLRMAIASISTRAERGSSATATVERAGG